MKINPYLNFSGQCQEAFEFYEKCLGGKILAMLTHESMPAGPEAAPGWQKKIMHACLPVDGVSLMGSDVPPGHYQAPKGFSVSIQVTDDAEAERIYHALSEGGVIQMPIQKTFWATRFGMFVDRFGIPWMVNCGPDA